MVYNQLIPRLWGHMGIYNKMGGEKSWFVDLIKKIKDRSIYKKETT